MSNVREIKLYKEVVIKTIEEIKVAIESSISERDLSLRKLAKILEDSFGENGEVKTPYYNTLQKLNVEITIRLKIC